MKAAFSLVLGLIGTAVTTSSAHAQVPENSPLIQVYSCKAISEPLERLACFDNAVGTLEQREAKKEIVAIDSETAKTFKREAFGFSLPSLPKLGLPSLGDSGEDEALELEVKSVNESRVGYTITMKNGQVWREVSGRLNYIPRGDLTATISKGAMGSYLLSLSNGKERVRGLGVRRLE